MQGYITSYKNMLTRQTTGSFGIRQIEIPLIQRDYAQGRPGGLVERVRTNFLNALHGAVTGGEKINLDFIFGDVENGTMLPLVSVQEHLERL